MAGIHRDNEITRNTVHRVYHIGEELRRAINTRRSALGMTVREFAAEAVQGELPGLMDSLRSLLPSPETDARPARLPMTELLLDDLREASQEVGIPAARLLLACLARAAARKRRRPDRSGTQSKNSDEKLQNSETEAELECVEENSTG